MTNEEFLPIFESLQNDVAQVGLHLREISRRVIDEGISEYPVFVAAQEVLDLGRPIFDRDSVVLNWFFSASILEEFVRKRVVLEKNVKAFKDAYGDPLENACIFVITRGGARFVFIPYQIDENAELT